ncbi:hypothetical protein ACVN4A_05285 [Escherichia coli]|uniref:hypothetical protein n=1 Tax=Citrobacter TaxID=544 RepID=UPI0025780DF7|nr:MULTISPECIES: hypothetical protein [Citrobacter]MDU1170425.1 hypothetical protein [Citrobacter freundii]MDL4470577.1 hypothetical protein [Citrobacter braakii]MDL4507039.1 hypothetical protein [Citrobacter braakii]MDM2788117.1 hypothetical protein [Citrobacter sp. Cpo113]MDU1219496.1 hypothetical protein [Citrobacter freundii]
MYYFTYETVISYDDKTFYYYGKHCTKKMKDGYKGSGVVLQRIREKHKNNPTLKIVTTPLEFFNSHEILMKAEEILVQRMKKEKEELCVNIAKGGIGSPYHYMSTDKKKEAVRKMTEFRNDEDRNQSWKESINIGKRNASIKKFGERRIKTKARLNYIDFSWEHVCFLYELWSPSKCDALELENRLDVYGIVLKNKVNFSKMIQFFEQRNPKTYDCDYQEISF